MVTSSQIFVSAFAQQASPSLPNTDDNFTNANINNDTLSSSNSSSKPTGRFLIKLYDKVDQSIVQVTQKSDIPGKSRLGSGFVYDKEGHIVTNYTSWLRDNISKEFDVTLTDGSTS